MSRAFSLAGFELTLIGRIWVTPEAINGDCADDANQNRLIATQCVRVHAERVKRLAIYD